MKRFLTVDGSRNKRAHIVYKSHSAGDLRSLCKTTDAGPGPRGKVLAHTPSLTHDLPEGYTICRACLLRAYDSGLLEIGYKFDRSLVEIKGKRFVERPLTLEEYEAQEEKKDE